MAIRLVKTAAVVGAGVLILRRIGPGLRPRIGRMFEEASEDFPPKWMYVNITSVRENTEQILAILKEQDADQ